jgi:tetratricopeptide (TPR) repeat protein
MAAQTDSQPKSPSPRGNWPLTVVLLLLAVAVVGVTVHYLRSRGEPAPDGPPPADPLAEARQVRAKIEDALAVAEETAGEASLDPLRRQVLRKFRDNAARFVELYPRDVIVRPVLAKLELELGNATAAERVVSRLLELSPGLPEGVYLRARVMRLRGEQGYLALFRQAADADPADAEINTACGLALFDAGDDAAAEPYLRRAVRARREAGADLTRADARALKALGVVAMRQARYEEAAALLGEAAAADPSDLDVAVRLVEAHRLAGDLDAAEDAYRRAETHFNKWADRCVLSLQLAEVLRDGGRFREAAEVFAAAARHQPLRAAAALQAAKCYYEVGEFADAMVQIDAAAAAGDSEEIRRWQRKIEDARFGPAEGRGSTTRPAGR